MRLRLHRGGQRADRRGAVEQDEDDRRSVEGSLGVVRTILPLSHAGGVLTSARRKTTIRTTNSAPRVPLDWERSMALLTGDDFTKSVLNRWEDIPDPRLREVMQSAIKHLHAFVGEVRPTGAEWFKAIEFLTAIGHKCDDKRQEFILASDVMGVSMLVDDINNRRVAGATPSTVEGPFHIPNAPELADGGDMAKGAPGIPCFVSGTVRGLAGEPIGGADPDPWQTDGEGLYEEQRRTEQPW